jgi:hypothetical protein
MKNLQTLSISPLFNGNVLAMSDYSTPSSNYQASYIKDDSAVGGSKNVKKSKKFKKFLPLLVVVVLLLVVGTFAIRNTMNSNGTTNASILGAGNKVDIQGPKAEQKLDKSFNFPLRDAQGKKVSELKYEIQTAELRDEIIVKGQKATAVGGRTFLILNLKITNSYDKSIQLNSKDYVRLIEGDSPEKLAADIHNDPVDVQAISTKFTRLGFPINDKEKSLTLQVGEISGPKQTIKLDLK